MSVAQQPTQDSLKDTLVDFVRRKHMESRIPGIVVGILHNGSVVAQGFGITNVDHPLPVTDTTLYQIGSITKTFTGTLIMRLVEQGKLSLDAPVRTYLPDFRVADAEVSAQVTLRHLMTHLAGWEGDLFLDTGPGDDALVKYVATMAKQAQLVPLGTHWSYNNAGFAVLGLLIETVTAVSYERVLKEQLLEPLGMTHSYIEPTAVMTERYAVGHSVSEDGIKVMRPWHLQRAIGSMGGLITDVHDLLRYARFQMGDGSAGAQPLISTAGLQAMHTPQVTLWGDEQWGLTWGLGQISGTKVVSHTGGTNGQITRLMLLPERNFAVAVFTNAQQGSTPAKAIAERAIDLYLGLQRPEPQLQKSSAEELAQFVGFYANAFSEVELGLLAGRLVGQMITKGGFPTQDSPPAPPPPPVTMGLVAGDRLMMLEGGMKNQFIDVVRTPTGEIGWLRIGARLYRRTN